MFDELRFGHFADPLPFEVLVALLPTLRLAQKLRKKLDDHGCNREYCRALAQAILPEL